MWLTSSPQVLSDHDVQVLNLHVLVGDHVLHEDHVPQERLAALDEGQVNRLPLGGVPRSAEGVEVAGLVALLHVRVVGRHGESFEADADGEGGHVVAAADPPSVHHDAEDLRAIEACGWGGGCTSLERSSFGIVFSSFESLISMQPLFSDYRSIKGANSWNHTGYQVSTSLTGTCWQNFLGSLANHVNSGRAKTMRNMQKIMRSLIFSDCNWYMSVMSYFEPESVMFWQTKKSYRLKASTFLHVFLLFILRLKMSCFCM